MLFVTVGKKKVELPTKWEELKIKDWIRMVEILKGVDKRDESKDEELSKEEIAIEKAEEDLRFISASRDIFAYLANLSQAEAMQCSEAETAVVINKINYFLTDDTKIRKERRSFEYKGITYYFPKANMQESTFEDYIETSQLQILNKKSKAGRYDVVAEQIAILCREEGEEFDVNKIKKKTKLFSQLTMDIVWDFIFFLTTQANILIKSSQMSSTEK